LNDKVTAIGAFREIPKSPSLLQRTEGQPLQFGDLRVKTGLIRKEKDWGRNLKERWVWEVKVYRANKEKIPEYKTEIPYEQWGHADQIRRAIFLALQIGVLYSPMTQNAKDVWFDTMISG